MGRCSHPSREPKGVKELSAEDKELLAETTRRCPHCDVHIEKNGGCNSMLCSQCWRYFLWNTAPFSRFMDPTTRRIREEERREAERREKEQERERQRQRERERRERERRESKERRKEKGVDRSCSRRCTMCRAVKEKTSSSNHLVCSNCQTAFCFLCGMIVMGTSHFAPPSPCPQHS